MIIRGDVGNTHTILCLVSKQNTIVKTITFSSSSVNNKELNSLLKKHKIGGLTGIDTRSLTNFIRDNGAPKGTIEINKSGKLNIKKLLNKSVRWHGLNGLDLAKNVSTKTKYNWSNFKTWKKETGFQNNKTKNLNIIAIDYGITKKYVRILSKSKCKH